MKPRHSRESSAQDLRPHHGHRPGAGHGSQRGPAKWRARWALAGLAAVVVSAALGGATGCKGHGKKLTFEKGEVYYKEPVTKEQARRVGDYLLEIGYFDDEKAKTVQLRKSSGKIQLRFVLSDPSSAGEDMQQRFKMLGGLLSHNKLDGAPVEVHLCDRRLRTKKTLAVPKALGDFGKRLTFEGGEVYYRPPVKTTVARKLGDYLVSEQYFAKGRRNSVQLVSKGDGYQVRFVFTKKPDDRIVTVFRNAGPKMARKVFGDAPFTIAFCDEMVSCYKTIGPFGK